MPLPQWPDNLTPVVIYERCVRCGINVSPSSTWGRMCRDCRFLDGQPEERCGTVRGRSAHLRRGEDVCEDCAEANRLYDLQRRAQRQGPAPKRPCPNCQAEVSATSLTRHIKRKHSDALVPA